MTIPRFLQGASLLFATASVIAPQTVEPANVWHWVVKDPLSAPNGEAYFASALKETLVPAGHAPYLEGVLVSITPETVGVRRLLVSMEGTGTADVTIILRGQMAKLKIEPKKGTVVHFRGVIQKFTKPFMVTFLMNRWGSFVDFVNSR